MAYFVLRGRGFLSNVNVNVLCCRSRGYTGLARGVTYPQSSYHSCAMVCAKESESVRKGSSSNSKSESGRSVLMQLFTEKKEPKAVTVGAKVVQAGKDMTYLFVILGGFGVAGFLLWSIGSEFFMSDSPSTIFTKASKRVKADPRVVEALGEPITAHGEMSGRGRRRQIAHQEYIVDGESYMRVKFYVDGSRRKGEAHLDLKKNDKGKYECRFLFVELKGYPGGTIILEDNR